MYTGTITDIKEVYKSNICIYQKAGGVFRADHKYPTSLNPRNHNKEQEKNLAKMAKFNIIK